MHVPFTWCSLLVAAGARLPAGPCCSQRWRLTPRFASSAQAQCAGVAGAAIVAGAVAWPTSPPGLWRALVLWQLFYRFSAPSASLYWNVSRTHLPSVSRRTHRPKISRRRRIELIFQLIRYGRPQSTHLPKTYSRHLQLIRYGRPQLIFRRRIQDIFSSSHKDVPNSSSARLPKTHSQDDLGMSDRDVSRVRPSDTYSGHLYYIFITSLGRPKVISLG